MRAHRRVRTPARAVLVAFLVACAAVACTVGDSRAATRGSPQDDLYLDFESGAPHGSLLTTVTNRGTAEVSVRVAARDGGTVTLERGPSGGDAARFPAYTGLASSPTAALVVRPTGSDALDPGSRDFAFGATFRLDATSYGSSSDNGDNLVQRGGYLNAGQYKLQVDGGVPSCRVAGDDGVVFVRARQPVERGVWYDVTCHRTADRVRLSVTPTATPTARETWRGLGATGHLSVAGLPLSIGGKVGASGVLAASADQFNGLVDDVFVSVG